MLPVFLSLIGAAHAQGLSLDVELLRPTFSESAGFGVDDPTVSPGSLRVGFLTHYAREPLVLYEYGQWSGPIIEHRVTTQLGASWDVREGFSARVVVPVAAQWGTSVPDLAAEVVGLGDITAGMRWSFNRYGRLRGAVRGDLSLPVGVQNAWLGEAFPRLHAGLITSWDPGPVKLVADTGVTLRAPVDTTRQLTLGQELVLQGGAVAPVWGDHVQASASIIGRLGFYGHGAAEIPVEATAGLHLWPTDSVRVDLGVGKGIGNGYGTSAFRTLAGVTVVHRPPPDEILVVEMDEDLPEEQEPPPVEVPQTPGWDEGEVARLADDRIELREPIRFELGTANILPESLPVLQAIADILNREWAIGELLIEGHASEEGSYEYNHDLSILRAASVYRKLVTSGVHPERLAYRGMGEVVPVAEGLAASRRVEFEVLRWVEPGDEVPAAVTEVLQPWDGEPVVVTWPQPPPKPPEEEADPDELQMVRWSGESQVVCDEEIGDSLTEAEAILQPGVDTPAQLAEGARALAQAERGLACGPLTDASTLSRFWVAAGAAAIAAGDRDEALLAMAAAVRTDPEVDVEAWADPEVARMLHEAAETDLGAGWITVTAPPDWWSALDGHGLAEGWAIPAGLYVVQAGWTSQASFARVVRVEPHRETIVSVTQGPATTSEVLLASTLHDPWADRARVALPLRPEALESDIPWPDESPTLLPAQPGASDGQPVPFAPTGLRASADVYRRPSSFETWRVRTDSKDLLTYSAVAGGGALGMAVIAGWSRCSFGHADSWRDAQVYGAVNHTAIITSSALLLGAAGLGGWALYEGRW